MVQHDADDRRAGIAAGRRGSGVHGRAIAVANQDSDFAQCTTRDSGANVQRRPRCGHSPNGYLQNGCARDGRRRARDGLRRVVRAACDAEIAQLGLPAVLAAARRANIKVDEAAVERLRRVRIA